MTAVADDVLAETRAFNAELERQLAANPATNEMPVEQARRQRLEGGGIFPAPTFLPERARDLTIEGRSGPIGLRVVAPEQTAVGAYLHIHGGGWALSAANLQDPLLVELADATGLCAVSVDYRLAPEHPYPAAPDDCEDAALWLLRDGFEELGLPELATIGGDSAGGHLSAVTLLRLRDRHAITGAFAAANLIYGAFDLSMTPSQRLWGERNLILSTPILHYFGDMFLPGLERRGAPRPGHLAALRRAARHAARALHRRHDGPAARRLALHARALGAPRARPPSCARGRRRSTASTPSRCG